MIEHMEEVYPTRAIREARRAVMHYSSVEASELTQHVTANSTHEETATQLIIAWRQVQQLEDRIHAAERALRGQQC